MYTYIYIRATLFYRAIILSYKRITREWRSPLFSPLSLTFPIKISFSFNCYSPDSIHIASLQCSPVVTGVLRFPSPWISTHSERLMKQRSHCCTLYPAHFPASKDVWYLARLCRRRRDCDVLLASSIFFQWRRRFFLSTRNWNAVDFCQASVNWTIFFSLHPLSFYRPRERGMRN